MLCNRHLLLCGHFSILDRISICFLFTLYFMPVKYKVACWAYRVFNEFCLFVWCYQLNWKWLLDAYKTQYSCLPYEYKMIFILAIFFFALSFTSHSDIDLPNSFNWNHFKSILLKLIYFCHVVYDRFQSWSILSILYTCLYMIYT